MTDQTPQPVSGGFDLNKSTIISLIYIAGFVIPFGGIVGFILAIVWKDEVAGTWEESHLQYHFMTFVIGLVVGIVGAILTLILIGVPILIALTVWILVRAIMPLLKAQKQEPMPNPKTFLF